MKFLSLFYFKLHDLLSCDTKTLQETIIGGDGGGRWGTTSSTRKSRAISLEDGTGRQKVGRLRPDSRRPDCTVGNTDVSLIPSGTLSMKADYVAAKWESL